MDIKTLLEQDHFICRYQSNTYNGTYSSPCPWCGGEDRFRCFPNHPNGGNYLCQKCKRSGGVLKYLVEFRGLNHSEARLLAGINPQLKSRSLRSCLMNQDIDFKKSSKSPCNRWQVRAADLVKKSAKDIWHKENVKYLDWLMQRGLTASTIREYSIGFNVVDNYVDRLAWGIDDFQNKPQNMSQNMLIPKGIVIRVLSVSQRKSKKLT